LVANFVVQSYTITAMANPVEGGYISGTGNYNHNSTVNLVATPNTGYEFVNWTEGGTEVSTSSTYDFTATADRNLVANFVVQSYTITAMANPVEGGYISGTGNYNHNSTVNLVATPNTGYEFVNWTEGGTEVSTSSTYDFTATADRNLVANFVVQSYTITATANPVEGGYISGTGNYNHNSTVNLVATPNTGYEFVNWTDSENEVSTNEAFSFTATTDRNLVANFSLINSVFMVSSDKFKLNIYPNPTKDILNINFWGKETINSIPIKIYVYNSVGKVVKENYYYSYEGVLEVPISDIPPGIYLIDVQVNNISFGKGRVMIIK
ncbi:MAG: T9SS type A sorting domain-containing protein, partial [Tenuifilaceae bacterium]|nr:T9SS type A sorting domain-containing protein [Tenuifilaceae bacterium]